MISYSSILIKCIIAYHVNAIAVRAFVWGRVFPGLSSSNVVLDCEYEHYAICCSNLSTKKNVTEKPLSDDTLDHLRKSKNCVLTRRYTPSQYELSQQNKAIEIQAVADYDNRKAALIEFISSEGEIDASIRWLARVKSRMNGNNKPHHDDLKYLSYFNVTQKCPGNAHGKHWIEWIEPLTVHARNPFSLKLTNDSFHAKVSAYKYKGSDLSDQEVENIKSASLIDPDFVLLKSSHHMDRYSVTDKGIEKNYRYMFDAGTSRFDSSLWWFTCGYEQVW